MTSVTLYLVGKVTKASTKNNGYFGPQLGPTLQICARSFYFVNILSDFIVEGISIVYEFYG